MLQMQTKANHEVATLVRDALYERRVEHDRSFVHDPAAAELEECGASAIPIIESVILSDAEGNCPVLERTRYNDFPGLLSVMRAYFVISDRCDLHHNAATFLESISFGVRLDALDAIHRLIYWDKALPNVIRGALTKIMEQVTPTERAIIEKILSRHKRRWWQRAT